jgi:dTDP-4-amino-4,6-dideoxygalactose transaminase
MPENLSSRTPPGNVPIPFNRPHMTGHELDYIAQAHSQGKLAGDGPFTGLCHDWLEKETGSVKALLTHSCTAALEMAALLMRIEPGDEIILPSFTFVSTANAFVLRGAKPVFVDIRPDTLNIDETLIEAAIAPRTKAIVVVHYAGVACEMDSILSIARSHSLFVVEDAAQGIMARYKGKPLGSLGNLGCYSFHETKNVISGEGGALLVNETSAVLDAEIIREKGTNRNQFFRGEVDKYTWQSIGSSFLPGELTAAFLWAQLEEAQSITNSRIALWNYYHTMLEPLEAAGALRRPIIPADCTHNAHLYYVLLAPELDRDEVLRSLKASGIHAVFHYVPLHSSPAGKQLCTTSGNLPVTDDLSARLIRLPMWVGLSEKQQHYIGECLSTFLT